MATNGDSSKMSTTDVQAFIRFLAQDAKVPLAMAVAKMKDLQQAGLQSVPALAKSNLKQVMTIFEDEKLAKQVFNASKRILKKRAAGEEISSSPKKQRKETSIFLLPTPQSSDELEESLRLPYSDASAEELADVKIFSNRAPLVLAMTVMLLKYTMPEQPLSSRLSLAQGYVSTTSRARAVSLGIEVGKSADEEGFGEGQPRTSIMGKELKVLRRWGYEFKPETTLGQAGTEDQPKTSNEVGSLELVKTEEQVQSEGQSKTGKEVELLTSMKTEEQIDESQDEPIQNTAHDKPPLWALDLEALKKSTKPSQASQTANTTNMPIYTPQSARAYLAKSFESPPNPDTKKPSSAQAIQRREENLGMLLRAIDLLYTSWLGTISPDEIEKRVWGWYIKARPAVESGVAGWGGKNVWKLADILASRREPRGTLDAFVKKEPKG